MGPTVEYEGSIWRSTSIFPIALFIVTSFSLVTQIIGVCVCVVSRPLDNILSL